MLSFSCFIYFLFFFPGSLFSDGAFQNHSRLRTPPLPLSHSHSPNHQHHAASINSLNRSNYTPRSNASPAPTDSSAPPEGPASGQDSSSVQDNWLLNSNIPLETRYHATCLPNNVRGRHVGIFRNEHKLLPSNSAFCVVSSILCYRRANKEQSKKIKTAWTKRPNFLKNTIFVENKRKVLLLVACQILADFQPNLV